MAILSRTPLSRVQSCGLLAPTLGEVRGAILDLREMTDFVVDEIRLAYPCLGPERILFVVDTSKDPKEWEEFLRAKLGLEGKVHFQFACWRGTDDAALESFIAEVRGFKNALPPAAPGMAWNALPRVASQILTLGAARLERLATYAPLAIGAALVVAINLPSFETGARIWQLIFSLPLLQIPVSTLAWYFILSALFTLLSFFRRDPLARLLKRKSRLLLIKNTRAASSAVLTASLLLAVGTYGATQMLRRAAGNAYENEAIANLRALNNSCMMYSMTYSVGFPAALSNLQSPGRGAPNSTAADLIDPLLASGVKSGYTYTYTPGPTNNGLISTYTIKADPIQPGKTGTRFFFTDESGAIHQNFGGPATSASPPIY